MQQKYNLVMNFSKLMEANELSHINQDQLLYKDKVSTHDDIMEEAASLKLGDYSCLYESQSLQGCPHFQEPSQCQFIEPKDSFQHNNEDSIFRLFLQPLQSHNSLGNATIAKQKLSKKKKLKNSNIIKKIGRIIVDNIDRYDLPNGRNGAKTVLAKLENRANKKDNLKNQIDGFNTSDLKRLFGDEKSCSFNLKTTRKIFTQKLRKEVLDSYQIQRDNKAMYLTSLKCSALRFMNKRLAVRLEISEGN